MTTLDIVVPTYNRKEYLEKTINSIFQATQPDSLDVTLIIVDNNCSDGTEEFVRGIKAAGRINLLYVKEPKQGLSNARNCGIASGKGELIGFIDDDEQIHISWLAVVEREFRDPSVQFIGGTCAPVWGAPAPKWLPHDRPAIIGIVCPQAYCDFNEEYPGMLMGGNAVIMRTVFDQVGRYSPELGRTNIGLLSDEDADLYRRILIHKNIGRCVPDLIIHHFIPAQRLTKRYHRSWSFWHAVSQGVSHRNSPHKTAHLAGVPRYLWGDAVRAIFAIPVNWLFKHRAEAFRRELCVWDLAGYLYGSYRVKVKKCKSTT